MRGVYNCFNNLYQFDCLNLKFRIPISELSCPVDNPEYWENIWRDYNTKLQRQEYDTCEKLAKKQNLDKVCIIY